MSQRQSAGANETFIRRYEYDDRWTFAADIGHDDVDVDVVGTTAIVVAETDTGVSETEFELPDGDAEVTVKNGVITITVAKSA